MKRENQRAVMKKRSSAKPRHPPGLSQRAAAWILEHIHPERMDGSNQKQNRDLLALYGGSKEAVYAYYLNTVRMLLKLCALVFVGFLMLGAALYAQDRRIRDGRISRPGYGELARREELVARTESPLLRDRAFEGETGREEVPALEGTAYGWRNEKIEVEIESRQYTTEQVKGLLSDAAAEAMELLPGENVSADHVCLPMVFPKTLAQGRVKASWMTMPYGVIEEDGTLSGEIGEDGVVVSIEGELTCQDQKQIVELAVRVYPPDQTEAERARSNLEKAMQDAEKATINEEYIQLPQQVGGEQISWSYADDHHLIWAMLLLLILPFLFYEVQRQRVQETARIRHEQLEMDYPEVMWKMTLLIGAGMNLSSAFSRIAEDYRNERDLLERKRQRRAVLHKHGRQGHRKRGMETADIFKKVDTRRYVYEEMLITCNEIRDGISEAKAYERFGHRCSLPRYIRLGSILSQNLRKGSKGLVLVLEQEALDSSRERRAQARKLGEKAGTKLLLPMILMMLVVFVILIAPAFLNMQ